MKSWTWSCLQDPLRRGPTWSSQSSGGFVKSTHCDAHLTSWRPGFAVFNSISRNADDQDGGGNPDLIQQNDSHILQMGQQPRRGEGKEHKKVAKA